MNKTRFLISLGLTLGLGRLGFAQTCVDSTCQVPGAGTITGHTITTIGASVANSGTSTPNPTATIYIMEATESGTPSNTADSVNGTVVIIGPEYFGSGNVSDNISGNIGPTVGGTSYNIFAKACPAGQDQTNSLCSAWVPVGTGNVTTAPYPPNPGFLDIAPADTAPQQFTDRTSGVQDSIDVLAWQLKVNNDDADLAAGSSSLFTQQPFSGASNGAGAFAITSSQYASLLPNLGYTVTNNLIYSYNKAGPTSTPDKFFTQPVNPVPITPIATPTHCSVTLVFQNSASSPANPADSPYTVAVGGPVSGGSADQTVNIGGGNPASQNQVTFTNLIPGTAYAPTVQAENRGGVPPWLPSTAEPYPGGFSTAGTAGTFTISAITTTGGTFNFPGGFDVSGATSWQVLLNGAATGPSGSGLPPASIPLTLSGGALNSNTLYTVQIQITEASCSYTVPQPGVQFYTLPVAPTAGSFGATTATTIVVNWTDGSTNATPGTTYHLQYSASSNSGPWTDFGTNPSKVAGSAQSTTITGLTPLTTYYVQVKTVSASGTPANDSTYFLIPGSAETLDTSVNMSAITYTVFPSSISLSVSASGGIAPYLYHWSVSPNTGTSFTANDSGSANNTFMLYSTLTSYTITVTATDNSGAGPGVGTQQVTVNPSQVPTTIIIAPSSATVVTGNNQVFTATVYDQTGTGVIVGQSVNWLVSGGGSLSTGSNGSGVSTTFTATTPGSFTLTGSFGSATPGTAAITVLAAGPVVDSFTFNMSGGNKGGTLTIIGHDNVAHTVSSQFNSSDPSVTFTPTSLSNIPDGQSGTTAVTFSKAGTFTLSDSLGSGVSTNTVVTVLQTLTSIKVCAVGDSSCLQSITVQTLQTQQFTATGFDQFGNPMNPPISVSWSGADINGAGAFNSPTIGQQTQITATSGSVSGHINVNTVSFDVSGAYGYPVPCKANQGCTVVHFTGLGSQSTLHIYTASGRRVFDISLASNTYDWPIANSSGENVASGVYFYIIQSSQGKKDGKLIIIK